MKKTRLIATLLIAVFGGAGLAQATVTRRQSEAYATDQPKTEARSVASDLIGNATDDSVAEEMAKKKKKKKKKKSRAS